MTNAERISDLESQVSTAEASYHAIVKHSPNALLFHRDDIVIFVNPAAVKMFGACDESELIGKPLLELVHGDYRHVVINRVRGIVEDSINAPMAEMLFLKLDQTPINVEVQGTAVVYEGKPTVHVALKDITENKRTEESLRQVSERLREALKGTIQVISDIARLRDSYTSQHQRNVSTLAMEIAVSLGLSEEDVDHVGTASLIHDTGKIAIPAEILSKPDRLSVQEFELVKLHATYGYEVIRKSKLPNPVLLAVWQHHERLNGSGYPNGLKGDEICFGAKILAVADTADAMMNHRPYRPAKGKDSAILELLKNKGILYDERVVDMCITILNSYN